MTLLYAGGESSRLHTGSWYVLARFHWPWGQPGEHETEPCDYLDAMRWCLAAPFAPLIVSDPDTGRQYPVRVESARIVRA